MNGAMTQLCVGMKPHHFFMFSISSGVLPGHRLAHSSSVMAQLMLLLRRNCGERRSALAGSWNAAAHDSCENRTAAASLGGVGIFRAGWGPAGLWGVVGWSR